MCEWIVASAFLFLSWLSTILRQKGCRQRLATKDCDRSHEIVSALRLHVVCLVYRDSCVLSSQKLARAAARCMSHRSLLVIKSLYQAPQHEPHCSSLLLSEA